MINEERAEKLLSTLEGTHLYAAHTTKRNLILSYADEIRRECAEKAVSSFLTHMARSEIAIGNDHAVLVIADHLRAAIMGKEAGG